MTVFSKTDNRQECIRAIPNTMLLINFAHFKEELFFRFAKRTSDLMSVFKFCDRQKINYSFVTPSLWIPSQGLDAFLPFSSRSPELHLGFGIEDVTFFSLPSHVACGMLIIFLAYSTFRCETHLFRNASNSPQSASPCYELLVPSAALSMLLLTTSQQWNTCLHPSSIVQQPRGSRLSCTTGSCHWLHKHLLQWITSGISLYRGTPFL